MSRLKCGWELARYNHAEAKGGDVSSSQMPTVKQGMMG